jgi:flagellar hook-associated protein 1 FlgK
VGTLFSALDIARSGLQAAQVQMDVAGHNIANVNKEGFSRQRVSLTARYPNYRTFGALGRGVQIANIERVREAFLDTVFRQQAPKEGSAQVRATYFTRIEDIFQEPSDSGLATRLNDFFDAVSDFANNVEEQPVRLSVVTEAGSLAGTLRQVNERLELLRTNTNEEARNLVPEINSLAERIAELNLHIRDTELGAITSNDMRDERDSLLDELAGLINITVRERPDGQVDVLIAGDTLVNGANTRQLAAVRNPALDPERSDLVEIRFADNDLPVTIRSGEIYGALSIRDGELVELGGRIDTLAATIIEQVNRIQSQGSGLANLSGTITSTNLVSDAGTALGAAGLPFAITPGTFDVVVYDAAGNATTNTVTVTDATTLESLAADLNAIPDFSAAVAADGQTLELGAASSFTFSFSNDTSGALVALGINGLFTGHDASTIGVNPALDADPSLLTSGFSLDVLETGDNAAALAMADVRNMLVLENDSATINDYYESTIVEVGVFSRANQDTLDVERAFVEDFRSRREEVSGVSLDEEVTNILQFQRAFEASARVITTVDRMLETLLTMV